MVNDFSLNLGSKEDKITKHTSFDHKFTITFVDTGKDSQTGARLKYVENYITEDTFLMTYGDGVSDVDIRDVINFHKSKRSICTITGVHPSSKYGNIRLDSNGMITRFKEKPLLNDWINGGFFVMDKKIFGYIDGNVMLEREPFDKIIKEKKMHLYKHEGFWHCMDTYKDVEDLNNIFDSGNAPWITSKKGVS